LDAVTMNTKRTFDGIYSNKVLQHLTPEELRTSLERQAQILNNNGILLHSLWYGDNEESFSGLRFVHYTETTIEAVIPNDYTVVAMQRYTEMEADDSFYIVLRKRA
jgi:predicted SAM-dependent methyltransferase